MIQTRPQYISDGNTVLFINPNTTVNVSLQTDDTQMVYTQMNAEVLPCPPAGLQFDKANKNCVCGKGFSGTNFAIKVHFDPSLSLATV